MGRRSRRKKIRKSQEAGRKKMEEQDKSLADPQTVAGQSRCTVEQLTKKNNKVESAATTTTEASPLLAKKPGDSPQTPLLAEKPEAAPQTWLGYFASFIW